MRVGVEVGGTFTDLVSVEEGLLKVTKVPSTPSSPERGVLDALRRAKISLQEVEDFIHGSTVATNAVLERKGARVALVTTAGFRDLLWIQRQNRPRIYDLIYAKPVPLVERAHVIELRERVAADGTVILKIDAEESKAILKKAIDDIRPEAVAICFLNAYANHDHERFIANVILSLFPQLSVICSHDISPEFREYERSSTTVMSAYVAPVISGYLGRLQSALDREGFKGRLSIMQSNGGRIPAEAMRRNAVTALFSGPAAGVIGATTIAGLGGFRNLITFDMGGTSTDVCLISAGSPALKPETEVEGLPVRTPALDIGTVGAGGGSIIWLDGRRLRVGPRSSGAHPGPACYGRGGVLPTITDAHIVRGMLRADRFLSGQMKVDRDAAAASFRSLADELNSTIELVADNAIRIANASVVHAIQRVSTQMGRDPRDYALVAFGGAGPLHAARVAEELRVSKVIVPRHAGVLSALGLLASNYALFEAATRQTRVEAGTIAEVQKTFASLRQTISDRLARLGLQRPPTYQPSLQMRYVGQAFEIDVPVSLEELACLDADQLRAMFRNAEALQFASTRKASVRAIEIVGFRLGAIVATSDMGKTTIYGDRQLPRVSCSIYENRSASECQLVSWPSGNDILDGPAIVDAGTSTVFIPSGWRASLDAAGSLLMTFDGEKTNGSRPD